MRRSVLSLSISVFLAVTTGSPAFSQSVDVVHRPDLRQSLSASEGTAPIIRTLAIGTILTLAVQSQDARVQREAVDSPILDMGGIDLGDAYGNGAHLLAATAATWGFGLVTHNSYTKETAGLLAKSLLFESVIVYGAKNAFGRGRPDGSDHLSFPSGHTAGAFTFSTVMARRYGWKVGLVGYSLSAMTAGARLEDNRHYLSDVIAGATVGIAVGQFMTRGKTHNSRKPYLYANGSGAGIALAF